MQQGIQARTSGARGDVTSSCGRVAWRETNLGGPTSGANKGASAGSAAAEIAATALSFAGLAAKPPGRGAGDAGAAATAPKAAAPGASGAAIAAPAMGAESSGLLPRAKAFFKGSTT
jgi:hypothetical protein